MRRKKNQLLYLLYVCTPYLLRRYGVYSADDLRKSAASYLFLPFWPIALCNPNLATRNDSVTLCPGWGPTDSQTTQHSVLALRSTKYHGLYGVLRILLRLYSVRSTDSGKDLKSSYYIQYASATSTLVVRTLH